jgi:hypothetical protein
MTMVAAASGSKARNLRIGCLLSQWAHTLNHLVGDALYRAVAGPRLSNATVTGFDLRTFHEIAIGDGFVTWIWQPEDRKRLLLKEQIARLGTGAFY